jgi:hypothetical protein
MCLNLKTIEKIWILERSKRAKKYKNWCQKYRVHIYQKSGLVIIITPQESLGPSSGSPLHKLRIIERLDFFGGTAEHGQNRQTNRADSQGWRPFCIK